MNNKILILTTLLSFCCSSYQYLQPEYSDGKFGYINDKKEFVIPPKYDYADNFNEGMARICCNKKFGFINEKGVEIIETTYDYAQNFEGGYAIVGIIKDNKLKFGAINRNGFVEIDFIYDKIINSGDGILIVKDSCSNWKKIKLNR